MRLGVPEFSSRKELFKWLIENKNLLIARKKSAIKLADGVDFNNMFYSVKEKAFKADDSIIEDTETDAIQVRAIINTTNLIDSYLDLHIPGLWDKSLKENGKRIIHLQEHEMKFDKVISDEDDLKAYTENYSWKALGYDFQGKTEALVFDSTVRKERNEYMFKQYARKRVKNHSVGMHYVKLVMCINDENYGAEFEAWEKYIKQAVNPEVAEAYGYFWAVTEAKAVEGSAVVKGANYATPTLETDMKSEPQKHSGNHKADEPQKHSLDIEKLLNAYTI